MSIPLPLTTVEIVDPAKPVLLTLTALGSMTTCQIQGKLSGHKPTKLLAALVRFQMQNILCKMQGAYPMLKCEEDFGIEGQPSKESFQASRDQAGMGMKDSRQRVLMRNPRVLPDRWKEKKNPWTKDQQVWYLVRSTSVSFAKRCVHQNPA